VQRITVCVRSSSRDPGRDVEVPAEVGSCELAEMLAIALIDGVTEADAAGRYGLAVLPSKRELLPNQSLADAEVWDGADLVLVKKEYAPIASMTGAYLESETGARYALSGRGVWIGGGRAARRVDEESGFVDLSGEPEGRTVSRQHAFLSRDGQVWRLAAHASASNPTCVNGEAVPAGHSVTLRDGDVVQLGAVRLRFRQQGV